MSCEIRLKLCLVPTLGQEPMSRKDIDPLGDHTRIMQPNGHSIKPTSNDSLFCPLINLSLPFTREASISSRWWLTKIQTTGQRKYGD